MDISPEFSHKELANATDNFSLAKKIGQGGFGEVYYGELRGQVCNHSIVSFTLKSVVRVWRASRHGVHIPSETIDSTVISFFLNGIYKIIPNTGKVLCTRIHRICYKLILRSIV